MPPESGAYDRYLGILQEQRGLAPEVVAERLPLVEHHMSALVRDLQYLSLETRADYEAGKIV